MLQKKKKVAAIILTAACVVAALKNKRRRKPRRWWVKPWMNRNFGNLELPKKFIEKDDPKSYLNYLRMDESTFQMLLSLIRHRIEKHDTRLRECIPVENVLMVTLRYLATGESFRSLMYNYRISESSISNFVPKVCLAIYEELKGKYLKVPTTTAEWLNISKDFEKIWNLPNILGAMDGKHITIKAQNHEGSAFFNYKKQHSIVLFALVDAKYNFIYINVGTNGRVGDGGVYRESDLYNAISRNLLNFPEDQPLPLTENPVPFVIAADSAFPLSRHILKPYSMKNITKKQRIFNYRLSRARRVVENTFGILANRFRVLLNVSALDPNKAKIVTQACCALHNFLAHELNSQYTITNPEKDIDRNFTFVYGLSAQAGNRPKNAAIAVREQFMEYVNGVGSIPWQEDMVK